MTTLSFAQIEDLWDQAGGNPGWAPLAAGIAEAESGGDSGALNNDPSTGDYSVGLWQINYYGDLLGPRTQEYGSPSNLQASPAAQAQAAVELSSNGADWQPWETDRAWSAWESAGAPSEPGAQEVQSWLQSAGVPTGGAPSTTTPAPSSSPTPATTTGIPIIGGLVSGTESWVQKAILIAAALGIGMLGVWKMANPSQKIKEVAPLAETGAEMA